MKGNDVERSNVVRDIQVAAENAVFQTLCLHIRYWEKLVLSGTSSKLLHSSSSLADFAAFLRGEKETPTSSAALCGEIYSSYTASSQSGCCMSLLDGYKQVFWTLLGCVLACLLF